MADYLVRMGRVQALRALWRPARWQRLPGARVKPAGGNVVVTAGWPGGTGGQGGSYAGHVTHAGGNGGGGNGGGGVAGTNGGNITVTRRPASLCWGCGAEPPDGAGGGGVHVGNCPVPPHQRS